MEKPRRRTSLKRRIVRWASMFVLGVLALSLTGWPQQKIAESVARRFLGAELEITGLSILGPIRIEELKIYDSEALRLAGLPTCIARGVAIEYTLFPQGLEYFN